MNAVLNAVTRWTNPDSRPLFKGKLVDNWDSTGNPGTPEGPCMCAQGDVLFNEGGYSTRDLKGMAQSWADRLVADLLGISLAHSILLRNVNDKSDGQPQNVLTDPASVLGVYANQVLSLWLHFDELDRTGWDSVYKRVYAYAADDAAAYDAAAYAAYDAAAYAAYDAAAYDAAAYDAAYAAAAYDAAAYAADDAAAYAAYDAAAYDAAAYDAAAYAAAAYDAAYDAAAYKKRVSPYTLIRGATMEIIGQAKLREQGLPFRILPMFGFDTPEAIPALYKPVTAS